MGTTLKWGKGGNGNGKLRFPCNIGVEHNSVVSCQLFLSMIVDLVNIVMALIKQYLDNFIFITFIYSIIIYNS